MSDLLAEFRDDAGNVRAHGHRTYVQQVGTTGDWFPVCASCGMLTVCNFETRAGALAVADEHSRNSGTLIAGF